MRKAGDGQGPRGGAARPSRPRSGARAQSRDDRRPETTVIYGRNPVREALRGRRAGAVHEICATAETAREPWLGEEAVRIAASAEIAQRCGSSDHQGVCAQAGPYPYADAAALLQRESPLLVVLDQVQDPQNLGAICRTAECAGADGVVIHERHCAQVTAAVCKASAGAVEHLPVARVRNVADFLGEARRAGCWCYGAAAGASVSYTEPDYGSGGVALVLGSEGRGLRPRVAASCDRLIALPVRGRIESLGVGAAAAAILYGILQDRPRPT